MEKIDGFSMDIEAEARERLKSVFPECFAEGQLDIDKLLTMCGEYISNDFEKYKFEWHGKSEAMKLAQRRSAGCLRPCPEESADFDTTQNLYIEGDNLEVLKLLQTAYFRQVKMIYIDPPYNTGNDFVYEDDFKDPLAKYLEVTSQATKSNPETMGRFHTAWLNMMYPRLRLAANLLRDDGVIFISIDDNEVFNLKKVCDEVFGEENYIAMLPRVTKKAGKTTDAIARNHDYILLYSKSNEMTFNLQAHTDDGFKNKDEYFETRGYYKLNQTLDYDSLQYSPSLDYPLEIEGETFYPGTSYEKFLERKDGKYSRADWAWRWSKDLFDFGNKNGFIVVKRYDTYSRIYTKTYQNVQIEKTQSGFEIVNIERTKPLSSLEFIDNQYSNDNAKKQLLNLFDSAPFDYSKPVSLLKFLIAFATREDDIILDFFSGSGTTAHAVMQLNAEDSGNRRFICVQIPELTDEKSEAYKSGYENICEIGKERIRRAGQKIKDEAGMFAGKLDTGFKVFKLDTSNLKLWDGIPVGVGNGQLYFDKVRNVIDGIKDDRGAIEVVYELMLKLGIPLTCEVVEKDVMGKTVYSVDGDLLLFCLEHDITAEFVEALADLAPAKIILAEMGFSDDSAMANAHYILQDKDIEIKLV